MQTSFFLTYFEIQSTFMDKESALKDLYEINSIIDRSKRYTSISGVSIGIAGVFAIIGLFMANGVLKGEFGNFTTSQRELVCMYIFGLVLVLSLLVMFILSSFKSVKSGEKIWNDKALKCLYSFFYPIATGGILSFLSYQNQQSDVVLSIQLIFYGLACIAGSPFSFKEFKWLGIGCLILGITSVVFPYYNLIFWGIGFGLFNIGYGLYIHFKYEK